MASTIATPSRRPTIVVAPDKFKGSLPAPGVAGAIARGLARVWPDAALRICPMADGGDGTLDAVLAVGGKREQATLEGADGKPQRAEYGVVDEGGAASAVIEVAQVVGLTQSAIAAPVTARSTRGLGLLMRTLLDDGVRRFRIGLGGSSTNDGGAGLLEALGVRWLDAAGRPLAPTPDGLRTLASADRSGLDPRLATCEIAILSDVDHPLTGSHGATATFGPQKGVAQADIDAIDGVLAHYAQQAQVAFGRRVQDAPGAGAAGGLGFALMLLGGALRPGAEVVADLVGLDAALAGADWMLTGEGRSDAQTLGGKAPLVAAQRAARAGVPATLLSGAVESAALPEFARVFAGCFALPDGPLTLDACIARADVLLADRAEQIARVWQAARMHRR